MEGWTVTKSQRIDTLKDILVKTYHPAAIYLYGSHAWGKANELIGGHNTDYRQVNAINGIMSPNSP